VLRAALTGFLVWAGYGVLRPLRDEIATADHTAISDLWTGTFFAALLALPIYGWLAARTRRSDLIPRVYLVFAGVQLAFWAAFRAAGDAGEARVWSDRAFYIWTSIYNLFVLSLLWSLASDTFRSEQGKRLFGLIAAGITVGQLCGSAITALLVRSVGLPPLLLFAAATLALAAWCARGIPIADAVRGERDLEPRVGGGWWQGLRDLVRDPYLRTVTVYLLLFLVGSGFIYLIKSDLVGDAYADRDDRRAFLARIELFTNSGTLLLQLFLTGRAIPRLGIAATLAVVPAVSLVGFTALALAPGLMLVASFEVLRRIAEFAMSKPAREVLFTAATRQQRFQSKPVLDTLIYRGGDLLVAEGYEKLAWLGCTLGVLAACVLPFAALGLAVARRLGRKIA
jgi:AAA family ATP:ADP antiporter